MTRETVNLSPNLPDKNVHAPTNNPAFPPSREPSQVNTSAVIIIGVMLIVMPWVYVLEQWLALTWWNPGDLISSFSVVPIITAFLLAPAWLIAGFVFLFSSRYRTPALWIVASGILAIISLFMVRSVLIAVRHKVFEDLEVRSKPVVAAIKAYESSTGSPPERLDVIVPDYLRAVPGTGIPLYPNYKYRTESTVEPNRWELFVPCSSGVLNWDIFLYLPYQNYPTQGYGGTLEAVGDWAYVHE